MSYGHMILGLCCQGNEVVVSNYVVGNTADYFNIYGSS